MGCNCEGKKYSISMGCCVPVLGPIENYYTKYEIDEMLEEIESAITSGCCITPEEVDEKISAATSGLQETLIAGDNIIISGNVISASGCDCDLSDYYTKEEVDAKIPSLSGYATEQWVEDQHYLTEHQPLKTINGQVISGTGNIEIECESGITSGEVQTMIDNSISGKQDTLIAGNNITISGNVISASGCDLSDYYTTEEIDLILNDMATKTWVLNQNYATYNQFIQYVTNLQNQIDSLRAQISGCCGSSGETQYRWITMTGTNDYWCDGTDKKTLEKEQSSTDGFNWIDTGNIRSGSTVLEYDSADCGYDINTGMKITLNDSTVITIDCEELPYYCHTYAITHDSVMSAITNPSDVKQINIGTCVGVIGHDAFSGLTNLQKVVIPTSFHDMVGAMCDGIDVNAFEKTAIRTVGMQGSGADVEWNNNMDNMASQLFKSCTALTSVELHSSFVGFQPKVFSGCTNLQSITLHCTTLPDLDTSTPQSIETDGLDGIGNDTFVIYVPSDMVDTYKNAVDRSGHKNWSKYASHIQAIP